MSATVHSQGQARIRQRKLQGVSVISPLGAFDSALADDVRERCLEAHAPVIIDLNDCVVADTTPLLRVSTEWPLYRPHMCIVAPRATARRLLRRSGVDQHIPVFSSVEQALDTGEWRPRHSR